MDPLGRIAALPTWQMYAAFLVLAVVRGFAYYLGGALIGARAAGDRWRQAQSRVRALGARSVVATWPVYGLAAATQVACGAVRIPLPRFAAALVAMAMLWAGLQTAVGVAVLEALATRATPWMVVLLVALVVVRVALSARRRRADAISAPSHG